jgi:3'-5' exoribonuclease
MKSPYVSELQSNQLATGVFLVQSKDIRLKKSGEPFLSMVLTDRTGDIDAKMWDNVDKVMETFSRDDFVKVKGLPQVFHNRMQFTVHTLVKVSDAEVDFADYFPASQRDPEEMFAELKSIIASIANPHLRGLLEAVFADPEIARKFKRAPAAKSIHHAWLGGLLEHVLSLCALCRMVAAHYPHIDAGLLLTGAILHDIGKIDELTYDRGFGYSTDGQLLGHLMQGLRMVGDKFSRVPDFPPRLRSLVEHMIISHHGVLEFGSPKVPMFAEALLLHHLDNLDSKMETVRAALAGDKFVNGDWTGYISALDRTLLKKDQYLNNEIQPPPPPAPAPKQNSGPLSPLAEKLRDALKDG